MTAEPLSDEAVLARLIAFDTTSHQSNCETADFISFAAGPEDGDRGLVLSGHMDVVAAE